MPDIDRLGHEANADGLPLGDVTVLAVEQFGAGPWATMQLADLGARVIKIEDPSSGGDVARYVPPYQEGTDSLFFETFNRGKDSVCLDLRTEAGREAFGGLVGSADAVFCNLRGDLPERLGLTYDALKVHNPAIVACSLSGFGRSGPRASEGAYDYVLQAMAGWMSLTGEPGSPPTRAGLSLVDFSGGYVAALALLSGLWRARRDGRGCDCDTSLFEVALSLSTYLGTWAASRGHEATREPRSAHPSIVPFQIFATSDGWIAVACAKEKFWLALVEALGLDEVAADERFADFAGRLAHRAELEQLLAPSFSAATTAELARRLSGHGVPCGPVNDLATALNDPQVVARNGRIAYEHPRLGHVEQVASPLRVDGAPRLEQPAPSLGADTASVLEELCGYDPAEIDRLAAEGAFG